MRIDLQLDCTPDQAAPTARRLAATGVDGVFTFEGRHDAFLPLAAATSATATPLPIMTNIAVALPRSPLHLAHLAHDLQLLSKGNFVLGLGSQVRTHIERRYGATWSKPAARMREWVAATKEILHAWHEERRPEFHGEFTRHDFMPPAFTPAPQPWGPPPVMMGALGPLMTQVAGEVSDGLLVMPFNTREHILATSLPALQRGAEIAGRSMEEIAVVPQVIAATGATEEEIATATGPARSLVAFYASTPAYASVLEHLGRRDLQGRLSELGRQGEVDAMAALIDDDLFEAIAVRGTPEQCAHKIRAKFAGIGDRACVYFPGAAHSQDTIGRLVQAMHAPDKHDQGEHDPDEHDQGARTH